MENKKEKDYEKDYSYNQNIFISIIYFYHFTNVIWGFWPSDITLPLSLNLRTKSWGPFFSLHLYEAVIDITSLLLSGQCMVMGVSS